MRIEEKRNHPRLSRNESVYIRVLLGNGESIETQTEDVSAGGFRARLNQALESGIILHVVIETGTPVTRFLLAAEVKWCQAGADEFHAGFEMLDAQGTDYEQWQNFSSGHS